jgi:intracellular multiplication protein IcmD
MSTSSETTATMEQVGAVVNRAQTDPAFRHQLLTSAIAALQSQGITMPPGMSLQVLENGSTRANLVVPAMPADLSADARQELASLAGSSTAPDSALDAYAKLIIDAWQNGSLKQQLLTDPAAVLAARGITIPAGVSVSAVEASAATSYLLLPSASASSTGSVTIGGVAESITDSLSSLTKLITAGAYLSGLAFSLSGILKFKQHKDNPTQIPVGTPIALLFVGAILLFLPSILNKTGTT